MEFLLIGIGFAAVAVFLGIGAIRVLAPKPVTTKAIKKTQLSAVPDLPQPFGYKTTWLAVKSDSAQAVFEAIGLLHQQPANWETGLKFAFSGEYDGSDFPVFVTPPVDSWVLVVTKFGITSDSDENIAALEALLGRLSATFGEAQFFGSYRIVDYIAWYRAVDGEVTRGFSFADGGLHANSGQTTSAELENDIIEMTGLDEAALWEALDDDEDAVAVIFDEEAPMRIAGEWSVNPLELRSEKATGLAGILTK